MAQQGINVNQADKYGRTPVYLAAQAQQPEMLEELFAKGADANTANTSGTTPLIAAAEKGHVRTIELLLTRDGISLDAKDKAGQTALMVAAANGYIQVVEALVKAGARMDITDYKGMTAYDHTIQQSKPEVQAFLSRVRQGQVEVTGAARPAGQRFAMLGDQTLEVREGGGLRMIFNFWTQQVFTSHDTNPATPVTAQSFYDLPRQEALTEARNELLRLGGHPAELKSACTLDKRPLVAAAGAKP